MIRYGIFLIAFACCGFSTLPLCLTWTYPASEETPDLVFNIYYTDDPNVPLCRWKTLPPVPGYMRYARIKQPTPLRLFTVTAKDHRGESDPAKR